MKRWFYLFMISNFTLDTHNSHVQEFLISEKYKDDVVAQLNRTFKQSIEEYFSFMFSRRDFAKDCVDSDAKSRSFCLF